MKEMDTERQYLFMLINTPERVEIESFLERLR